MRHLEHDAQVEVVRWLRAANILHCSIPNGARTSMPVARRLKAEGMSAGAPDLLIFDPPPLEPWAYGVAIEMKSTKGRTSPKQEAWLAELRLRDWIAIVCRGAPDALGQLKRFGYCVPG